MAKGDFLGFYHNHLEVVQLPVPGCYSNHTLPGSFTKRRFLLVVSQNRKQCSSGGISQDLLRASS